MFALLAVFTVIGCTSLRENGINPANGEAAVRAEPVVQFAVADGKPLSSGIHGITIRCISTRERRYVGAPDLKQCMYVSADVTTLDLEANQTKRDEVLAYLLNLSDHNCATFMSRAFASKAGIETTRGTLKDIMTGLSAALAAHAPGASSVLGLANLAFGSSVDNFDRNYYVDKAFSAMENAIGAERARIRADISQNRTHNVVSAVNPTSKKTIPGYTMADALSDLVEYDQACSIQRGVRKLSEIAATDKKQQENNVDQAEGRKTESQLTAQSQMQTADDFSGLTAARLKQEQELAAKEAQIAAREKQLASDQASLKAKEDALAAKEQAKNKKK
jgi:hypothetical protein